MATPAVLLIETELPIMMTCLDNAGIEKGAVLVMTSPMTVAANNADDGIFGGIAASIGTLEQILSKFCSFGDPRFIEVREPVNVFIDTDIETMAMEYDQFVQRLVLAGSRDTIVQGRSPFLTGGAN